MRTIKLPGPRNRGARIRRHLKHAERKPTQLTHTIPPFSFGPECLAHGSLSERWTCIGVMRVDSANAVSYLCMDNETANSLPREAPAVWVRVRTRGVSE